MQQINVTVTDTVPEQLVKKMKTMGIDTDKIKFNVKKEGAGSEEPTKTRQFQVNSGSIDQATS